LVTHFDIYLDPFDVFMQPDPLTEALESVVGGDNDQLGGRLQAAELDAEVLKTFCDFM